MTTVVPQFEGKMRLDRYLVQAGDLSRSQAQKRIRAGSVQLNGVSCRDPARKLVATDRVTLDGDLLQLRGPRYLVLYKPAGYVCARRDDRYPTVLDLLPVDQREGLHVAGRLDLDTSGLVLLTDDGDWSHRVTSPRHGCRKRYRVTLAEPLSQEDLKQLREGVQLRGEARPTLPAGIEPLSDRELYLSIGEGRYHQVKRMFGALGNRVLALHRDRIGTLSLDDCGLAPGECRELTREEVEALG
jgi:16S rRNA pseudouridine516 synthase